MIIFAVTDILISLIHAIFMPVRHFFQKFINLIFQGVQLSPVGYIFFSYHLLDQPRVYGFWAGSNWEQQCDTRGTRPDENIENMKQFAVGFRSRDMLKESECSHPTYCHTCISHCECICRRAFRDFFLSNIYHSRLPLHLPIHYHVRVSSAGNVVDFHGWFFSGLHGVICSSVIQRTRGVWQQCSRNRCGLTRTSREWRYSGHILWHATHMEKNAQIGFDQSEAKEIYYCPILVRNTGINCDRIGYLAIIFRVSLEKVSCSANSPKAVFFGFWLLNSIFHDRQQFFCQARRSFSLAYLRMEII